MKNSPASFLLLASACIGLAAGGCSLFHHHPHQPKPPRKEQADPGPLEPNPQPMEAQPTEPQPRPMEPEPMEQQ